MSTLPPQQNPTMPQVLIVGFFSIIDFINPSICGMIALGAALTEKKFWMYSIFSGVSGGYIEMSAGSVNQSGMKTLVRLPVFLAIDVARISAPRSVCG